MIDDNVRDIKLCVHGENMSKIINEINLHVGFECSFGGQNIINKIINQSIHDW
jgi:hypothetical protein